jgi:asparagine synthase (glutamine-hydrolysing)
LSGIAALVRLDGGPASPEELASVMGALSHRGPDGSGCWVKDTVALGFAKLATTPEAASEILPLRHEPSGCVITADARLDNRQELAAALGLDARGRGDGELILHAYLRWGEEAPLYLVGDFAFIIWDSARHRLLAGRDTMGMRQLHYAHRPGRLLALATDDQALLTHPGVPIRLNEVRIAEFLEDIEGADLTSTFYLGVQRLPPGYLLVLRDGELQLRRFHTLIRPEPLQLGSDEAYAEAFLDVFEQAVEARLRRSTGRVGAMLSGGLDSSSIVAVASRSEAMERLPVFSAVSDAAACPETSMIRTVQASLDVASFEVRSQDATVGAAFVLRALTSRNPFDGHMVLSANIARAAAKADCNILLDGGLGDIVLDHRNPAARLLRRGRIVQAWHHARDEHHFWEHGPGSARLLLAHARAAFLPDWSRALRRRFKLLAGRLYPRTDLMRPTFARRADVAGRRDLLARMTPSPREPYGTDRLAAILHPNAVVGRERYDRVASLFGLEARDPFSDLRLVRFALSLPHEQLVRGGWTKFVLRNAMSGRLPEQVRWRRGKEHLGGQYIAAALTAERGNWAETIDRQGPLLDQWVRPESLDQAKVLASVLGDFRLQRIGFLASWLSQPISFGLPSWGEAIMTSTPR